MILNERNVATLLYAPAHKKKKKIKQKRNQNKYPPLSIKENKNEKSTRDSRPSQPAMRSTTKLGTTIQSLSKLTLKFCKTTLPLALHLTPIMKKKEREKNLLNKNRCHTRPGPIPLISFHETKTENRASTYIHSFGEIHFSGPEKKNN